MVLDGMREDKGKKGECPYFINILMVSGDETKPNFS